MNSDCNIKLEWPLNIMLCFCALVATVAIQSYKSVFVAVISLAR